MVFVSYITQMIPPANLSDLHSLIRGQIVSMLFFEEPATIFMNFTQTGIFFVDFLLKFFLDFLNLNSVSDVLVWNHFYLIIDIKGKNM